MRAGTASLPAWIIVWLIVSDRLIRVLAKQATGLGDREAHGILASGQGNRPLSLLARRLNIRILLQPKARANQDAALLTWHAGQALNGRREKLRFLQGGNKQRERQSYGERGPGVAQDDGTYALSLQKRMQRLKYTQG